MQPFYQNPLIGHVPYFVQVVRVGDFPAHWHGEIEVYYVISGRLEVVVNGQTRVLTDRMMTVVGSAEVHSVSPAPHDPLFIVAEMGYELLGEGFDRLVGRDFTDLILDFNTLPPAPLEDSFRRLFGLAEDPAVDPVIRDLSNRSLLCGCAVQLLEMTPDVPLSERRRRQVGDLLAMQRVLHTVGSRFAEDLTVGEAAALSGYEKTRFCQLFRRAVGMPFHKYLNQCRVNAAKHLLSTTDTPVRGIGEAVGLPEPKTFSRVFRAYTGVTPSEWRRGTDESEP